MAEPLQYPDVPEADKATLILIQVVWPSLDVPGSRFSLLDLGTTLTPASWHTHPAYAEHRTGGRWPPGLSGNATTACHSSRVRRSGAVTVGTARGTTVRLLYRQRQRPPCTRTSMATPKGE